MPTIRRRIEPSSRDYMLRLGEYEGDDGVASKVLTRIVTKRGSIVPLPNFGSLLHTIRGPIPGYETLAKRYTLECLSDLVRSREVNDLTVTVARTRSASNASLDITVDYRDRRGRRQTVRHTHRLTGA